MPRARSSSSSSTLYDEPQVSAEDEDTRPSPRNGDEKDEEQKVNSSELSTRPSSSRRASSSSQRPTQRRRSETGSVAAADDGDIKDESDEEAHSTANFERLKDVIVQNSVANSWKQAKSEWELDYIFFEEGGKCICGKYPITEHCVITRRLDRSRSLIVGNRCVQQMGGELSKLSATSFACLKKVKKDPFNKHANEGLITMAIERGVLGEAEGNDYLDLWRKRNLVDWQEDKMVAMNHKIITAFSTGPKPCPVCQELVYAKKSSNNNSMYFACYNLKDSDHKRRPVFIKADGTHSFGKPELAITSSSTGVCNLCKMSVRAELGRSGFYLACKLHPKMNFKITRN